MLSRHTATKMLVLGAFFICSDLALAQANDAFQFNFSTPGARNLALGGAFLGLADDATAAYTNPAGLVQLSAPEVSIEVRSWSFTSDFVAGGSIPGRQPTGIGIDTVEGLRYGSTEMTTTDPSFISLVYPQKKWTAALYRNKLANFKIGFQTQGTFLSIERRTPPLQIESNVDIVSHGFAGALSLGRTLSAGVCLSHYKLAINSINDQFGIRRGNSLDSDPIVAATAGGFYGAANFSSENIVLSQTFTGNDSGWGITAGFLWKIDNKWNLGGVYRQGPAFDIVEMIRRGNSENNPDRDIDGEFTVPGLYGLGFAFQPTQSVRITADYNYIRYSHMRDSNRDFISPQTGIILGRFQRNDTGEPHLGFEYTFAMKKRLGSIAARLGTWYEPNHKRQFEGRCESAELTSLLDRRRCYNRVIQFPPGRDQVHYTGGLGVSLRRLQIDAAFDFSHSVDTISLSTVFRMGSKR